MDGQSPRVKSAWVVQLGYCAPRAEPAAHQVAGRLELLERSDARLVAHLTLDGTGTYGGSACLPGSGPVHFGVDLSLAQ